LRRSLVLKALKTLIFSRFFHSPEHHLHEGMTSNSERTVAILINLRDRVKQGDIAYRAISIGWPGNKVNKHARKKLVFLCLIQPMLWTRWRATVSYWWVCPRNSRGAQCARVHQHLVFSFIL
jgi:hypothetical protein